MRKVLAALVTALVAVLLVQLGAGAAITPQTVTPTNTTINGRVNALTLASGRLFVGGQMTAPFVRLGALDPATGAVVWSAPGVNTEVRAMATLGGLLFVGGDFGLRIYNTSSLALVTTISCGSVRALEAESSAAAMIVGGNIGTCGGQTHKNLARVDVGTLSVDSTWTPKTDGSVLALAADASGIFVGGYFGTINGTARYRLGKVTTSGGLDAWSSAYVPNSGDVGTAKSVRALDIAAGRLFASWGESVNKTVIYNQATEMYVTHWGTDGDTQALLADGGNIYLGGHWYQFAGPSPSVHFAAFDASTLVKQAAVTPIPYTPMGVFAMISDGAGGLWLGGDVVGDWGTPATKVKRLVHLTPGGSSGTTTTSSSTSTSSTSSTSTSSTSTSSTSSTTSTSTTSTTIAGPDTTPPTGSITAPANGATVSGTITVSVSASDNVGVTQINLLVDGVFFATVTRAPYNFQVNTANYANGNHTLYAKVYDAAGNKTVTATVTISVQN